MKRFFKAFGWAMLFIAVYLVVSTLVTIVPAIIAMVKVLGESPDILGNYDEFYNRLLGEMGAYTSLTVIISAILAFVAMFFIYKGRKKSIFKFCGFSPVRIRDIALIAVSGIVFNVMIAYIWSYVVQIPALDKAVESYNEVAKLLNGGSFIFNFIAIVFAAPFIEEILLRGVMYNELKNGMPAAVAVILQALAFGLIHGNLIQGSYAFIMALALVAVYIWFRSIWANIILHLTFNLTSLILDLLTKRFGEGTDATNLTITIASSILAAALFFVLWKLRKKPSAGNENPAPTVASAE